MNYIKITSPDINNGLGFRTTLWVSGCSHRCPGCHNRWTWDYKLGKDLFECKEELYAELSKPYIAGLTLSGGDPLSQTDDDIDELYALLLEVKDLFPDKNIWMYMGDKMEEAVKNNHKFNIIDMCDYVVDGTFHANEKDLSLAFRGSKNQRIWKKNENGEFEVTRLD